MLRREISGFHYYKRETGLHILFDEVKVPKEEAMNRGPRHLSLMLTRRCNLNCPFCYVEKTEKEAPLAFLIRICNVAKELQVLDITLGGGEPTLHSSFAEFVSQAWSNYPFGISVTTNAVEINPVLEVAGKLSSVRISIDNKVRPLNAKLEERIGRIAAVHRVSTNILCSPCSSDWVREKILSLATLGTKDFLLIPEHDRGQYVLSKDDWRELDTVIRDLKDDYQIMVTSDAATRITSSTLETHSDSEYLFAHIDESGNIRRRSWGTSLSKVRTTSEIIYGLQQLNPLRSNGNENLV